MGGRVVFFYFCWSGRGATRRFCPKCLRSRSQEGSLLAFGEP
jgi:hypothetical protein